MNSIFRVEDVVRDISHVLEFADLVRFSRTCKTIHFATRELVWTKQESMRALVAVLPRGLVVLRSIEVLRMTLDAADQAWPDNRVSIIPRDLRMTRAPDAPVALEGGWPPPPAHNIALANGLPPLVTPAVAPAPSIPDPPPAILQFLLGEEGYFMRRLYGDALSSTTWDKKGDGKIPGMPDKVMANQLAIRNTMEFSEDDPREQRVLVSFPLLLVLSALTADISSLSWVLQIFTTRPNS